MNERYPLTSSLFPIQILERVKSRTVATNAGEDAGPRGLNIVAGGNATWYGHFGGQAVSYKAKHTLTI